PHAPDGRSLPENLAFAELSYCHPHAPINLPVRIPSAWITDTIERKGKRKLSSRVHDCGSNLITVSSPLRCRRTAAQGRHHFDQQDRCEDQPATEKSRCWQPIAEQQGTEEGGEYGLRRQKNRRLRRGCMALPDHLEREGNAAGKDACIEDLDPSRLNSCHADRLQEQCQDEGGEAGNAELRHGKRDRPSCMRRAA